MKKEQEELKLNKILIVDDDTFNLDVLEMALRDLKNSEIIRANDGFKVLKKVAEEEIDLIILDISMPELNGIQVLEKLKTTEETSFIPIIVVTSKTEDRYKALELGAEEFLSKPIDIIELRFRVNNLLRLKKYNDLQILFNQRLEEEVAKKENLLRNLGHVEQELELAREIQQSIIPKVYPQSSTLDVHGSCMPAFEVGGDYFDVFKTESDKYTVFVISDVSGHGFASALVSMQFRTILRSNLYKETKSFSTRVEELNKIMCEDNEEGTMFITGLFLRYCHETQVMEFINAGHHNPIGLSNMKYKKSIPIGIQKDMPFNTSTIEFKKGMQLFLYTDGIIEEENSKHEMYGNRIYKLHESIKLFNAREQNELILKAFNNFIVKQKDDVTILVIKAI
ncbi:MAG: Serine phosphatase RsbU, regulator of sigma subunit [uncultured Sulfurovum sp.]|uniref:Serine phosphatase RsbU, regulator of sigma subunit n=1 Tax=uncultured Sulfurovum sp. TaxID=269237 RepID=A0A6S6T0T3_9BACT|nr:MAG: Serine phosphatase RsbU, regulator of sigma subunit [uncultured Sulfurovum sp.]